MPKPLCPAALFSGRALGLDSPAQTWEGRPLHFEIKLLLTSEGVLPCLEKSIYPVSARIFKTVPRLQSK